MIYEITGVLFAALIAGGAILLVGFWMGYTAGKNARKSNVKAVGLTSFFEGKDDE